MFGIMKDYGKHTWVMSGPIWCAGSFLASVAWNMSGPRGLLCSPLQVSQIYLPGKIWVREVGLMPGAVSAALITGFLFSSIWGQDSAQGRSNCKESLLAFLYIIQRGSRDLSTGLDVFFVTLPPIWVWEGKTKICHPWKLTVDKQWCHC